MNILILIIVVPDTSCITQYPFVRGKNYCLGVDMATPNSLVKLFTISGTGGVTQLWSLTNDGYLVLSQNPNAVLNVISESDPQVHLETKYASDNQNVWTLNINNNLVYNTSNGSKLNGFVLEAEQWGDNASVKLSPYKEGSVMQKWGFYRLVKE